LQVGPNSHSVIKNGWLHSGRSWLLVMILPAALLACATADRPMSGDLTNGGLAGTSWKLISFQSMDDAQGTSTAEGREYSVTFNPDGTATGQFDCNRANSTWSGTATSTESGTLKFGPVAMTRALCPPPRFDELLGAQLPNVTSYILRDGHLFLALKMDGGIFEFEPN